MEAISQKANCYLKEISAEVNLALTGWWMCKTALRDRYLVRGEAIQVDNELPDQCVTTSQHSISTASQQPSENVL